MTSELTRGLKLKFRSGRWWATVRGGDAMPCIWDNETTARENCDPDEFVVRVYIEAVNRGDRLPIKARV